MSILLFLVISYLFVFLSLFITYFVVLNLPNLFLALHLNAHVNIKKLRSGEYKTNRTKEQKTQNSNTNVQQIQICLQKSS